MASRRTTQPPLFTEPCPVCHYPRAGEHEPWCPSFMKGAEPGGDPHEWPTLLDAEDAHFADWLTRHGENGTIRHRVRSAEEE